MEMAKQRLRHYRSIEAEKRQMEEQPEKQDESDRLFVTFSAEEIGKIVVSIIRGVERKEAIRAMPRYTREQHRVYAAFYEQLKEAIDWAWRQK
jgi:hypothetical protein